MVYLQESQLSRGVDCISPRALKRYFTVQPVQKTTTNQPNAENETERTGTQDMMQLVGNYGLPGLNSLYIFQGITDNSSEV